MLPLGNGFTPAKTGEKVLLIGGGVGVAPLLYMGAAMKQAGQEPTFLLGARTAQDGEKGFVTNHSILSQEQFDRISTCGPTPMMKAVARLAVAKGIACEASLENLMACGLGACLCCVEKTTEGNVCVCKDGPVFNIQSLLWE